MIDTIYIYSADRIEVKWAFQDIYIEGAENKDDGIDIYFREMSNKPEDNGRENELQFRRDLL